MQIRVYLTYDLFFVYLENSLQYIICKKEQKDRHAQPLKNRNKYNLAF